MFGLGSAELVESEWRRLKLKVSSPEDARGLLACTECAALDCLADDVLAETNKEKCAALLEVLALVHAPEAAVPMLRCKLSAKTPALARAWLDQHVGHAVAGLIETAAGRGNLAEAAIDFLRDVKRNGHADVIAAALKASANGEAAAKVQAEVLDFEDKVYQSLDAATTPAWLTAALAAAGSAKPRKLPAWAAPALLSPLIVGERRMNDEQVPAVLQALVDTPPATRHPLLVAIRAHVERHVRDVFAWKLYQNWQGDGYPSAGKWALGAVGHIGDDGCVLKLTPLIRAWPGESQHARAVFGLECLRAVGTSVALMQLSGIAQKLKFKGLQAKAEQFVEEIARDKGLTRAELEDRVVPDCGLDENGRRDFSFGPRSFAFVLGGDLKAMVRDADGKLRSDLPKPSGKDDEAIANASVAEWKLLKKQIKQVATVQAERLEKAMVAGRRWSPGDFETLLVRHPLMTHLVQKLIWGTYDADGKRLATFRVTEERDLADVDENAFDLGGAAQVGVVHPLEMTEQERGAWGQVLGDYEIITPFPQLGRKVYALEGNKPSQMELTRWVHSQKVVGFSCVSANLSYSNGRTFPARKRGSQWRFAWRRQDRRSRGSRKLSPGCSGSCRRSRPSGLSNSVTVPRRLPSWSARFMAPFNSWPTRWLPACWPKRPSPPSGPANQKKRSRSVADETSLGRSSAVDAATFGRLGAVGEHDLLRTGGPWWQGPGSRRRWSVPGVGGPEISGRGQPGVVQPGGTGDGAAAIVRHDPAGIGPAWCAPGH